MGGERRRQRPGDRPERQLDRPAADLGRAIDALDVSPAQRYVAAGVNGKIVVIDLQRNAIATMTVGSPRPKHLSFVDAATLAFAESATRKTVEVGHLEYVPFQATTEL